MYQLRIEGLQTRRRERDLSGLSDLPGLPGPAEARAQPLADLPFAPVEVEYVLSGAPVPVANALRRAVFDEMPWYRLHAPTQSYSVGPLSDPFMMPPFVLGRIEQLPLPPRLPDSLVRSLRLELHAENTTPAPRDVFAGELVVAGGELSAPLFNHTFRLAILGPGKRIDITDIAVQRGTGLDHATFQPTCASRHCVLDVEEHPRSETHTEAGAQNQSSGFKVSSLLADPRRFRLMFTLPAVARGEEEAAARAVIAAAAADVARRLRACLELLESPHSYREQPSAQSARVAEATLRIPGETHTVGGLLRGGFLDTAEAAGDGEDAGDAGLVYANYVVVAHNNTLLLTVRAAQARALLEKTIQGLIDTFKEIEDVILNE